MLPTQSLMLILLTLSSSYHTKLDELTLGGQPGHQGKTRKGFGRIDRYEISNPEICNWCGSRELSEVISLQTQQVACLVAKPIEVVEYQTQSCKCLECGGVVRGSLPEGIVAEQDLNINLQALLVWLGNYGHLSYQKQQELIWELGAIEIGTGTLQKTNQRVAEAVEPTINDLWEWATHRPNVHVDETLRVRDGSQGMVMDR